MIDNMVFILLTIRASIREWWFKLLNIDRSFTCQSNEEFREKCKNQCDHCKIYYEPIDKKYFPDDIIPKGWVDIEDHLPQWMCKDVEQGFSIYKVKYKDGKEFETAVTDHNIWYYDAKAVGITHWWND